MHEWSVDEVQELLKKYGFNDEIRNIFKHEKIDGCKFLQLSNAGTFP